MKPQTQILMIALAVTFAIALALTVALICISYIKDNATSPLPDDGIEEYPTTPDLSGITTVPSPDGTGKPQESTEEQTEPPKPLVSNGLLYSSMGNGTCSVTGIGTCADACVIIPDYSPDGDRVTAIAARAFFGCTSVTAIQIPASVNSIGALAFASCPNLVYISVSDQNAAYCDDEGVLYSADKRTLILYPPMRAGSSVSIRSVTTKIEEMAFYSCIYLKNVQFQGSAEQWEGIAIGSKNYSLTAASKTFGTGSGK